MLFSYFSSIIQVLGEHLLSIVYLDSSESLLGEAPDYEVSHSEEQLLIAAHLLMVLTPLIHNRLQPEPLGQRVTAHKGLFSSMSQHCFIMRACYL